jgi:hypothetical protein
MKRTIKNSEILDTIYHEAARVAAETTKSPTGERKEAERVVAHFRDLVAEQRRQRMPAEAAIVRVGPIRRALQLLDRAALLAKLATVQFAYRRLTGVTDDDLRRTLQALDPDGTLTDTTNADITDSTGSTDSTNTTS